jgi:hypothetical protein
MISEYGFKFGNFVLQTKMYLGIDKFSHKPLVAAIEKVVKASNEAGDRENDGIAKLVRHRPDGRGKMSVYSPFRSLFLTRTGLCADDGDAVIFRSYDTPQDAKDLNNSVNVPTFLRSRFVTPHLRLLQRRPTCPTSSSRM